jgi:ElaB/YqjD/DUF883 family membrane-anchored ribosome-binding protein
LHIRKTDPSAAQDFSYMQSPRLEDSIHRPSFIEWKSRRRRWRFFDNAREEATMNSETSESGMTSMNMNGPGTTGLNGNVVHRVAQKAHETVDKLEQTVATGSERVMTMQEEYGSYAREQIKAHPLSTVAGAFALGLLLGKILR